MTRYRHAHTAVRPYRGTWFFAVNLLQRRGNDLLVPEIDLLRNTVRRVQDWPYSTFHQHMEAGIHPVGWRGDVDVDAGGDN